MALQTPLLQLGTPVQGTLSGTWGDTVNNAITEYVDIAIAGTLTLTGDGAVNLVNTLGSFSASLIVSTLAGAGTVTAQFSTVRVSGTTTTKVITGPSYSKAYLVDNASSFAVTFKASSQTGVSISPSEKVSVYYNGTDYVKTGGGGITYGAVKTANYTAVLNDGVLTNTTGGAFTVTLPATPLAGTQVFIADSAGTWGTNNLTIGRNGSTIEGVAQDLVCDINSVSIQCVFNGTTWDIFAQIGANDTAVVTLNGTQTLTNKTMSGASNTFTNLSLTTAVTGTLPTANGGTGLGGATPFNANGVVFASSASALTTGSALVFDGNNLGLGATPSAWYDPANYRAVQIGQSSFVGRLSGAEYTQILSNVFVNASGVHKYINNGTATLHEMLNGSFRWSQAASGTAGNTVSFTQAMTLDASGNLGIGTTSPAAKIDVNGSAIISGTLGIGTSTFATNSKFAVQTSTGKLDIVPDGASSIKLLAGTGGMTLSAPSGLFFDVGSTQQFEARNLQLYSSGTIKATTSISVGNATPTTSGAGITFPADQTILGPSTNANTLDDYEEGTWTPSTGTGGMSLSTTSAVYQKVGNRVTCVADISITNSGSSAVIIIAGLPFTNGSTIGAAMRFSNETATLPDACEIVPSNTQMFAYSQPNGTVISRFFISYQV